MTEAYPIEVLDLRHYSARQLRPLLEQEADLWERRLSWDYRSSIELLLQYLDSRILPGFVATVRGKVCGLTFCVYEGHKAVIGDVFVSPDLANPAPATNELLQHMIELLEASPDVDRIESQLLLFEAGRLSATFHAMGFELFPRLYQECELSGREAQLRARMQELAEPSRLPAPLELRRWTAPFYQSTAELIHASYVNHVDSNINDQYRSLHGSLRFLHNIVRFPGCGVFDANCSWVLRDPRTNTLVATVLCSKIGPGIAHVTQLCVAPEWRGRNLGQMLMLHCMLQLRSEGYTAITLTVTEANEGAVRLYHELGFWTRHRFDAMVRIKNGHGTRVPLVDADHAPAMISASVRAK